MNQYIKICYKPKSFPNYWDIWFRLNFRTHRERIPSRVESNGDWNWWFKNEYQNEGINFDWREK